MVSSKSSVYERPAGSSDRVEVKPFQIGIALSSRHRQVARIHACCKGSGYFLNAQMKKAVQERKRHTRTSKNGGVCTTSSVHTKPEVPQNWVEGRPIIQHA